MICKKCKTNVVLCDNVYVHTEQGHYNWNCDGLDILNLQQIEKLNNVAQKLSGLNKQKALDALFEAQKIATQIFISK